MIDCRFHLIQYQIGISTGVEDNIVIVETRNSSRPSVVSAVIAPVIVVSLIGSPGAFVVSPAQTTRFAEKHDTDCVSDCVLDAGNDDIN